MLDRLAIEVRIWGLKLRNLVSWGGQLTGFAVLLLGAFMMFRPLLGAFGVPVQADVVIDIVQFYESLGLHWLALMIIGALTVWLTTRA